MRCNTTICLTILSFTNLLYAQDVKCPHASEDSAWQAIVQRFKGDIEVKRTGDTLQSIGITQFKLDPRDGGMAQVTFDRKSGNVIELTSNMAGFRNDEFKLFTAFTKLKKLTLWHNGIHHDRKNLSHDDYDAKGLSHLTSLAELTDVTLAGGSFGDDGMKAAATLPSLKVLNMWHCEVNDAGIAHLIKHPTLEAIRMGPFWAASPKITNKSLEYLATCPKLKEIRLGETWLTYDGGLEHLIARKDTLQILNLQNSLLIPADVEKIKASLPNADVQWEGLAGAGKVLKESAWHLGKARKSMPAELIDKALEMADAAPK